MLIGFTCLCWGEPVWLFRGKVLQMKSGQLSLRSCLLCFQLPLEYQFPFPSTDFPSMGAPLLAVGAQPAEPGLQKFWKELQHAL